MRRGTFDVLTSTAGLVLAVVLLVAGGLLLWGHSFVDSQVHNQRCGARSRPSPAPGCC